MSLVEMELRAGNKGKALDALEKAVADGRGSFGVATLGSDVRWDGLYQDPRFQALWKKIGLID